MHIEAASQKHADLIKKAFATSREQRRMHHADYLAEPGIADFHCGRLLSALPKDDNESNAFVYHQDGDLAAYTGIQDSKWHTGHFDVQCYKIQPFFFFSQNKSDAESVINHLSGWIRRSPSGVYSARIEAHQAALSYYMSQSGFVHTGTSVRMVHPLKNALSVDKKEPEKYDDLTLRNYDPNDLPILQEIGRRNHRHSHFFCEMRFAPDRVSELFAEWITKCVEGIAQKVFVMEAGSDIAGFATLLVSDALKPYINKRIGVVDFIVVDKCFQGKGVGKALLLESLRWFDDRVELVELRTMADNLQAIRFYEKYGFKMLSADQHYHYWIP